MAFVPFKPGNPGGPGRQKGSVNTSIKEGREACRRILEDPRYVESIWARLAAHTLNPIIEMDIRNRAWGKVIEKVQVAVTDAEDLSELPADELAARAQNLVIAAAALSRQPQSNGDSEETVN